MFATGLVNLYTRDIEAGLRFYRDLLGFTETFRTPTEGVPSHVELQLGGFTVGLGTVEAARRVHGVDPAPGCAAMALVVWTEPASVSLKCDPDYAESLRERYAGITPGYHLNKRHWNTVALDGSVPDDEVTELLDQSYDLVVARLTRAQRSQLAG